MSETTGPSWYGATGADVAQRHPRREGLTALLLAGSLIALTAGRLMLPWLESDLMTIHQVAMEALAAGRNWGRQALFASLEYPPLPMLATLVAAPLAEWLDVSAGHLLTAVCQAWALLYLVRIPDNLRDRALLVLLMGLGMLTPYAAGVALRTDPNWVVAVPLAAFLFHLARWERSAPLRDIVALSICLGLLVFCGIAGLSLALILTVAALAEVASHPDLTPQDRHGTMWLIASPVVYCAVLVLLFNWLVMGDPLMPFRLLIGGTETSWTLGGFAGALGRRPLWILPLALGLVMVLRRHRFGLPSCLLMSLAAVPLAGAAVEAAGVFPSGVRVAQVVLAVVSLSTVVVVTLARERQRHRDWTVAICIVASVGLALVHPARSASDMDRGLAGAPAAQAVIQTVDEHWRDSRILVYGIRAPAAFADPEQKRFIASVDFHEKTLLERARREQVHVLLPPTPWRQPSTGMESPADIRRRSSRYLLLEAVYPEGWQLWRCVVSPEGESHLPGAD